MEVVVDKKCVRGWHVAVRELGGGRYHCEIVEGDKWEYKEYKKCSLLHHFQAKF
jgi:hypothetical protein